MAVVTHYVCDISGKSGVEKFDFIEVSVSALQYKAGAYANNTVHVKKLVHIDIANRLNLIKIVDGVAEQPEVSFEGKLKALLTDYIDEIVADSIGDAVSDALSRRG